MVIHDSFPSSAIPLALCGTHTYSQRPSLCRTQTRPMLAFPSQGYTTQFWKFHWRRQLYPPTQMENNLYPVNTVSALSEMESGWGLYYVPTQLGGQSMSTSKFEFDFKNDYPTPSAVFVDLRRPEWAERQFNYIEELREEHPKVPFIFYTNRMDTAAKRVTRKLGVTPLRVTNRLLATATPTKKAQAGESELAIQERIIHTGPNFSIHAIHDERISSRLSDLYEMKDMLRDRQCAYPLVTAAYNSLMKLPVQPTYWTKAVATNPHPGITSTPDLIKKIRRSADDRSTADGDLLRQYADTINDIQGLLNKRHPVQNAVLKRIHDVARTGENTKFVVSNNSQRRALQLALDENGYASGADDDALIINKRQVSRSIETQYVYLYPPYRTDPLFEFPPSTEVEFMTFSIWKNVLADAISDATQDISVRTTTTHQNGSDDEDDFVLDLDALDDDIGGYLDKNGLSEYRRADETTHSPSGDGERIELTLVNHDKTLEYAPNTYVSLYDSNTAKIVRKRADAVSVGDKVLLIPSVADDLYEILIHDAHERESVRKSEERVEDWRAMLVEGMEEQGFSYKTTQKALAEKESNIKSWQTIKSWATGSTIGPQDPFDVKRTIELFRPELSPEFVERRWQTVWSSIKHIRFTHYEMGRNVRRYIETEMNSTSNSSFRGVEDEEMIRIIARDVTIDSIDKVVRKSSD